MARKKKTKPARFAHGASTWKAVAIGAFMLAGSGGVAYGLLVGVDALESRAATLTPEQGATVSIAWPRLATGDDARPENEARTWLPGPVRDELTARAERAAAWTADPFDVAPLRSVGRVLEDSGWFASTPTVRRAPDGAIEAHGTWRVPAAVVRCDGRDCLIGVDGRRLPLEYELGASGQRVILGTGTTAPETGEGHPDFETDWPGGAVHAGLSLLRTLSGQAWSAQVAAVDVGEFETSGSLVIVTDRGSRIVWGASVDDWRPGEVRSAVKLERLDALFDRFGRIDAGRNGIAINTEGPIVVDRTAGG